MKNLELSVNLIDDVKKKLVETDLFAIGNYLQNWYRENYYNSEECDKIIDLYFLYFYMDLVMFLGHNIHLLNTSKKQLKKVDNFFKRGILNAKIQNYTYRKTLYWKWMGQCKENDEILNLTNKLYPNINQRLEVKKFLGLTKNLEELKKELKELK